VDICKTPNSRIGTILYKLMYAYARMWESVVELDHHPDQTTLLAALWQSLFSMVDDKIRLKGHDSSEGLNGQVTESGRCWAWGCTCPGFSQSIVLIQLVPF